VTVATCYPQYNLTDDAVGVNYDKFTEENGIRVYRIKTLPHHKVNFIIRGISQLSLPHFLWGRLDHHGKNNKQFDGVVVYSPPLPLWKIGAWAKRRWGAKFLLNVQDIFPQNAVDLGAMKSPLLMRFFEGMERRAYRCADVVTVHSKSNRDFLLSKERLSSDKLTVLHNWVEVGPYEQPIGEGRFRNQLGLEGKFILFFGGVIGPSQGLDLVIETAERLRHKDNLIFLLVGDGTDKKRLLEKARLRNLKNVVFHPFVSPDEFKKVLKEMDAGIVCLTPKNKTPVVPGKIHAYMAAGLPVVAFLNRESDGHDIIRESGCGYSGISDSADNAAALIEQVYRDRGRLQEMGMCGHRYAAAHFSKSVCVDKVEALLKA